MRTLNYNREKAVEYARTWALKRNPKYYDFSLIGGDCTNFCSQILFAGAPVMNYDKWYYFSLNSRAPAWTGVQEFFNFITSNNGLGPFGKLADKSELLVGDFIQLGNENGFYHMVTITDFNGDIPLVCSHSYDRLDYPITNYYYERLRFIHVIGANDD